MLKITDAEFAAARLRLKRAASYGGRLTPLPSKINTPGRIEAPATSMEAAMPTPNAKLWQKGAKIGAEFTTVQDFVQRIHDDPALGADVLAALDAVDASLPSEYVNVPGFGGFWRPVDELRHSNRPFAITLSKTGTWSTTTGASLQLASTLADITTVITGIGMSITDLAYIVTGIRLTAQAIGYANTDSNVDGVADNVYDLKQLADMFKQQARIGFTVDESMIHPAQLTIAAAGDSAERLHPLDPVGGFDVEGLYFDFDQTGTAMDFELAISAGNSPVDTTITVTAELQITPVPQVRR